MNSRKYDFGAAQLVMPVRAGRKFRMQARVEILHGDRVGEVRRHEQRLAGSARFAVVITQGEANARRIGNAPAEISGERAIAKRVVRALALRFEIGNRGGIIESSKQAGKFRAAVARSEISAIGEGREFRNARGSAMRENLDHSIHRVRTVERAFRAVHDFNFVDVVEREIGEIDQAAGLIGGHAVHQHLGVIRIAAVQEQRSRPALRSRAAEAEARLRRQQIGQRSRDALIDLLARENGERRGRRVRIERQRLRGDDHLRGERLERQANLQLARFSRGDRDFLLGRRE